MRVFRYPARQMRYHDMNRRELMAFTAAAFAAKMASADPLTTAKGLDGHVQATGADLPDKLLLKDWRPRSIYKIPVTEITKARYPVVDVHNHGVNPPEQVRKIVEAMDETGVERAVIFAGTGKSESFA